MATDRGSGGGLCYLWYSFKMGGRLWATSAGYGATAASVIGGVVGGAAAGFAAGGITTGTLKGALQGAISGAIIGGIGGYYGETWNGARVAANGIGGGLSSRISGGGFKDGFAGAFFAAAVNPLIKNSWPIEIKGALRTLAGGTASRLGGGKFANGATSAAMRFLFEGGLHDDAQENNNGRWEHAGSVQEGREATFRLGHKVKIEGADDRASLHLNNAAYKLTFTEIGSDGKPLSGVYPTYEGVLSSAAANALATDRVIELYGPPDTKFDWTLTVPTVPKSCDNCGAPTVNIYDWRPE